MNEVAWCYLEGFGTKKDKVSHTLLRLRCRHFLRAIASPIRYCPASMLASWTTVACSLARFRGALRRACLCWLSRWIRQLGINGQHANRIAQHHSHPAISPSELGI